MARGSSGGRHKRPILFALDDVQISQPINVNTGISDLGCLMDGNYYLCFLFTGWNSRRYGYQLRDFLGFCRDNIGKRGKYTCGHWQESGHDWFFVTGSFGYHDKQVMGWEWKFLFRRKADVAKIIIHYGTAIKYQIVGSPSLLVGSSVTDGATSLNS